MTVKIEHETSIDEATKKLILSRMFNVPNLLEMAQNDKDIDQIYLREAIRISYYGVFQTICRICTEALCESNSENTKKDDWLKIFRSFDHKDLRNKLNTIKQSKENNHSKEIKNAAKDFSKLQEELMKADYDPSPYLLGHNDAIILIKSTVLAAIELENLSLSDKRSLAITLLFKDRP